MAHRRTRIIPWLPTIETLDDWNTRLAACDCCAMPLCPVPVKECQSLPGGGILAGQEGIDLMATPCKRNPACDLSVKVVEFVTRHRALWRPISGSWLAWVKVTPEVTITMRHGGSSWGGYTTTYVDLSSPPEEKPRPAAYAAMLAALIGTFAQMSQKGDDCAPPCSDNLSMESRGCSP